MAILCFTYKRDFSYALLYTSIAIYVIFSIVALSQTGVGTDSDACSGLSEIVCKGEGQPCLYWTGVPCNATKMEDDGQEMCKWSNKKCQTNKNWFKTTYTIRDLPKICKVTQRLGAGGEMGQFSMLLLVFTVIGVFVYTPLYLYQHSFMWTPLPKVDEELDILTGNNKDTCYRCERDRQGCVRIHLWMTIFLILWNICIVVMSFSYSGALTTVEKGCLFLYDEDTDGELEWPDNSLFFETYFEGFTTPAILTMSGLFVSISVILLGLYVWFHYTYKEEVLDYGQETLVPPYEQPRRKRRFT
jgi:hypothetical protein